MYQISILYLYSFWRYVRVYAKNLWVTWPRPRPFSRFFFAGFWDIAPVHLCTKSEVSSSTRSEYTVGGTPKFLGSRDLAHAPFWIFLCGFLRHYHSAFVHQIWSLYLYSFWRYVRVYAKKLWWSRDVGHAPFLDLSLRIFEILPLRTCTPNFKSLALVVLNIR